MKAKTMMLAACLCAGNATGQEAHYGKMSPLVRKVAMSSASTKRLTSAYDDKLMTVFLSIADPQTDSILAANGCRVFDRNGDIVIATVPVSRLARLSSLAEVRRIEAGKPCQPAMDTTAIVVNAMPVYSGESLPEAFTGRGVVVGVMDIGFDLTHPTFYDSTATDYRIRAFWDQLSTDTVGSSFPVGRDYVGTNALLEKGHSTDGLQQTHGTHTLGIAAGSGYNSPYRGMAYESDICIVSNAVSDDINLIDSADIYKYTTATDALGFKYIFDYAASRGMPCVASFSEGSVPTYDTEDSLYSEYLSRLVGPGRIIVTSAGNESVRYNYIAKPKGKRQAGSFLYSTGQEAGFFVQSDAPFRLLLLSYGASGTDTVTINSDMCPPDTATTVAMSLYGGNYPCTATITRYCSTFAFGDTIFHVELACDVPLSSAGTLAVVVEGADASASIRSYSPAMFINGLADPAWADAETSHNVLTPGNFASVITVGSTIHRTGFTNYLGQYYDYSQTGRNDGVRSEYSSIGPTMDGRIKPDVMAPGDNVVSSYSSYYEENNPEASDINSDVAHFMFGGRQYAWNSNTGTSMAAPVVAGAIALWLQARPDLTTEEVLDVLSHTCRQPDDELAYPNNLYGYGEINVHKGLLYLLGIDGIDGISGTQPQALRAAFTSGGQLVLRFANALTSPVYVRIYSLSGTVAMTQTIGTQCDTTASIDASALPAGVYVVQTNSNEKSLTGSIIARK